MKKLLAILLAVAMIMGLALTASAKETTLPDVDCTGWWAAHSDGIEITEDGVTITFTNTTYADAPDTNENGDPCNWYGPMWILYSGEEAKVGGTGYSEYWVHRGDNYGWCVAAHYYGVDLNRWSDATALADKGISFTDAFAEGFDWANYLPTLKAGTNVTITAKLEGTNALITTECAGVTNNATLPVDTSKPVYLSLSGELTKLTNIKVTTPDPVVEPEVPSTPAEPTEDTVTELYGSFEATTGWAQLGEIKTTVWGGTLDSSFLAEGGYLSVNFSTEDISQVWQVRLMLNGTQWTELDWHVDPTSVANPVGTLKDLGNGNYTVTFAYDDIVAVYGAADFATTLGAIDVATNGGVPVTVTGVTYTVPAPEVDDSNPKDGDSIALVFALLAVSAAGIAVVAKKKEF